MVRSSVKFPARRSASHATLARAKDVAVERNRPGRSAGESTPLICMDVEVGGAGRRDRGDEGSRLGDERDVAPDDPRPDDDRLVRAAIADHVDVDDVRTGRGLRAIRYSPAPSVRVLNAVPSTTTSASATACECEVTTPASVALCAKACAAWALPITAAAIAVRTNPIPAHPVHPLPMMQYRQIRARVCKLDGIHFARIELGRRSASDVVNRTGPTIQPGAHHRRERGEAADPTTRESSNTGTARPPRATRRSPTTAPPRAEASGSPRYTLSGTPTTQ